MPGEALFDELFGDAEGFVAGEFIEGLLRCMPLLALQSAALAALPVQFALFSFP